ncbi:MAG: hypothetical protein ACI8QS_002664 [Planctomycetota bacterium]|jgi:hypothetical protein
MNTTPSSLRIALQSGLLLALAAATGPGCIVKTEVIRQGPDLNGTTERQNVEHALDTLHSAASSADGETYFALFDPGATYYGTDASELWSVEDFKAFAEPYFSKGRGWTYHVTERHVHFSPSYDTAWFDERLENESYGETRGTGVLIRRGPPGSAWHITQYNLSFPVPNELAGGLVEQIRGLAKDGQQDR